MAPRDKNYRRPGLWRHPSVLWRRCIRNWPIAIWILAACLCAYLYQGGSHITALTGTVETLVEPVAPLETARLTVMNVAVGQRVKAGEVLATMDTLLFDADSAVAEAQLIEVEARAQDFQQRILKFVRDFETASNEARFELESQRLNRNRDESVLRVLRAELARLEELRQKGLVGEKDLAGLRPEIAALEQTVAAYPALIKLHEDRLTAATSDEATMRALLDADKSGEPDVMNTITEMRNALAAILRTSRTQRQVQRENYALKATRDGVVSEIFHNAGDVVAAGEPVLRLVAENPRHILGFLPEVHLGDVSVGQPLKLWRSGATMDPLDGVVESIAPDVAALPNRISPIQGNPLRGRILIIRCTSDHKLIPGETLRIETTSSSMIEWLQRISSP